MLNKPCESEFIFYINFNINRNWIDPEEVRKSVKSTVLNVSVHCEKIISNHTFSLRVTVDIDRR